MLSEVESRYITAAETQQPATEDGHYDVLNVPSHVGDDQGTQTNSNSDSGNVSDTPVESPGSTGEGGDGTTTRNAPTAFHHYDIIDDFQPTDVLDTGYEGLDPAVIGAFLQPRTPAVYARLAAVQSDDAYNSSGYVEMAEFDAGNNRQDAITVS